MSTISFQYVENERIVEDSRNNGKNEKKPLH